MHIGENVLRYHCISRASPTYLQMLKVTQCLCSSPTTTLPLAMRRLHTAMDGRDCSGLPGIEHLQVMLTRRCFRAQGCTSSRGAHACMHASGLPSSTGRGAPDDAERVDAGQNEQRDWQRDEGVHGKAGLQVSASVRGRLSEALEERITGHAEAETRWEGADQHGRYVVAQRLQQHEQVARLRQRRARIVSPPGLLSIRGPARRPVSLSASDVLDSQARFSNSDISQCRPQGVQKQAGTVSNLLSVRQPCV